MRILAIETSTALGSVAISQMASGEQAPSIIASTTYWAGTKPLPTHSEELLPAMEKLLAENGLHYPDFDAFTTTIGPGAFTGVRVSLATLKGIAAVIDRPLISLSSLEVLATQVMALAPYLWVSPILDARKGEIYAALYTRACTQSQHLSSPARFSGRRGSQQGDARRRLCRPGMTGSATLSTRPNPFSDNLLVKGPVAITPEKWAIELESSLSEHSLALDSGILAGTGLFSYRPLLTEKFPLPSTQSESEKMDPQCALLYFPLAETLAHLALLRLRDNRDLFPAASVTPLYLRSF